jgi:septal ring factor EnvC (AmiA/AmiB activator)
MGGGPSKMTLISRLKNRDNDVAMVRQRVASVTQQRDELQRKLAKIRDEMTLIDETLGLEKDINNRNSTIDELLFRKGELEEELVDTQLLLLSVNKALEQI